jgi:tartrate-resistant acid phosphatase type 5
MRQLLSFTILGLLLMVWWVGTSTAQAPPAPVRFAAIGDFGYAGQAEEDVANLVKNWDPDFIITLGDNNYWTGSASKIDLNIGQYYSDYIYPYKGTYGPGSPAELGNRFFPCLGNHDWGNRYPSPHGALPYLSYFTLPGNGRYYEFVRGPVHFFMLDSDPNEPDGNTADSVQAAWLRSALAASTARWKLVVLHHPPYSSGTIGSTVAARWPFQAWGATAVLSAHAHDYERLDKNGFPYFVNGAGGHTLEPFREYLSSGSQVRYSEDYGAMFMTASDASITFEFITRQGLLIDRYTIYASPGSAPPAAPSALAASAVSISQINLTWADKSSNESGFKIEQSSMGSPFVQIAAVAAGVTRYSNTGLSAGTDYAYRVRAYNSGGDSTYSNTAGATTPAVVTLVPAHSAWRYLDDGSDQGTAWRGIAFDDSGWRSGAAELGYGDRDEATVVRYGPSTGSRYITTYFRRSFTVASPAAVSRLTLSLLRDDGAVVYLNGTEVVRSNMPTTEITYTTPARYSLGAPQEATFYDYNVNPSLLVEGTNVLAVEVHQANPTSSDLSFNLKLNGALAP